MAERETVARGLASALLAGEWRATELAHRARRALGERPRWLGALVRSILAAYPDAPRDARDELALAIDGHPLFRRAFERPASRPRIVRFVADEPAMGEMRWPVPVLTTTVDLARFLALEPAELDWLADVRGLERFARDEALRNYRYAVRPKRSGGIRVLEIPKPRLKAAQRKLLHAILHRIPPHPAACAFRPGGSTQAFAAPHAGRELVVVCDLEDFFGSIASRRVFGIYRSAGYPEAVARVLTALCVNRVPPAIWHAIPRPGDGAAIALHWRLGRRMATPHLPQGAPTSPALANLAAHALDRRLAGLAAKASLAYTRYADDLAFSGSAFDPQRLMMAIEAIVRDEGFSLRRDKSRVLSAAQRQSLAGWVVNRGLNPPRKELDLLEATLVNCVRHGPHSQNRSGCDDFRAHLAGKISWVASARPDRAAELRRWFDAIDWRA